MRDARADGRRVDQPVDRARDHAAAEQLLARADHDGAIARANGDDEHRLAKSARQSAPLADREAREAIVRADDAAVGEHEWTVARAPARRRRAAGE